jgi:hypothetical protein
MFHSIGGTHEINGSQHFFALAPKRSEGMSYYLYPRLFAERAISAVAIRACRYMVIEKH